MANLQRRASRAVAPVYRPDTYQVMHLNADAGGAPDDRRGRYELLDSIH
jgi:hypothetical protein